MVCCSPDCQPVLPVDFEHLDALGAALEEEPSLLLQHPLPEVAGLLDCGGKRLLSALFMAWVLRTWTRHGEEGEEDGTARPFERYKLREAATRLLVGMAAVFRPEPQTPDSGDEWLDPDTVSLWERLEVLQRMTQAGLNEQNATLALVPGIGSKWARKLRDLGLCDIEDLALADPEDVTALRGVSLERAQQWIAQAEELVKVRGAFCFAEESATPTPRVRCDTPLPAGMDPYRLRRALDLRVESMDAKSYYVDGGNDPHWVISKEGQWGCDCPDHAAGNRCKHLLAVQMISEPGLRTLGQEFGGNGLNLHALWHQTNRDKDPYGIGAAAQRTR